MNTLKIRDLVVGEGAPKIIVPIVGKTMQQILDKADELKDYTYDVVEWRVDFYEHALDTGKVLEVAGALRRGDCGGSAPSGARGGRCHGKL